MSRINTYPEADSLNQDDFLVIDGATDGTRKVKSCLLDIGTFDYQYINQDTLVPNTTWSYSSSNGFYRNTASGGLTADPFSIKAGTYYVIGFNGYGTFFVGEDNTRKTFYQLFGIGQSSSVQKLTFSQDGTVYYTGITSSSSTIRHLFADNTLPDSDVTGPYNILYNNVNVNGLNDIKNGFFPTAGIEWKKGGMNANGTIAPSSANRVYSDIIKVPCAVTFNENVLSTVFFYSGYTYVGKLNSTNGIDKISGSWGTIGGTVDLMQFIANYPAYAIDGIRFVLRNISNPADDAEAQAIGDEACTDRPSTIDYYNFAVFDITGNQIVSTKKIFAFGALQDCDFLDGKIVFMYGIPDGNLPSGMCMLNTSGDVIARIYDEKISDAEPEGCAFDHEYNRLLFCRGAYSIFSVTGLLL